MLPQPGLDSHTETSLLPDDQQNLPGHACQSDAAGVAFVRRIAERTRICVQTHLKASLNGWPEHSPSSSVCRSLARARTPGRMAGGFRVRREESDE